MRVKVAAALKAMLLLFGMLAFQACFERPRGAAPSYVSSTPVFRAASPPPQFTAGDWDEDHVWRDRAWWIEHRRDWVEQHHPDWLKPAASHGD